MKRTPAMLLVMMAAAVCLAFSGLGAAQPSKRGKAPKGPQRNATEPELPTTDISYQFGLKGQVGLTVFQPGRRIPLTFSEQGHTSTTVMLINGRVVEFGSNLGEWRRRPTPLKPNEDGTPRHGHWAAWSVGNVIVTQVVEVLRSPSNRFDTCLVYYTLDNANDSRFELGLRAMIDTQIAANDGNSFAVAGRIVTNFADFKEEEKEIPRAIEVRETSDPEQRGHVAYMTLKVGGDIQPPNRVSLTRWPGVSTAWQIPLKNIGHDAAVALYWDVRRFEAGAQLHVGYAYGQNVLDLNRLKEAEPKTVEPKATEPKAAAPKD
jgi:hypothetical protein